MKFEYQVAAGDFTNAGFASSEIKKILKQLNVNHRLIRKILVAVYEAEVNIVAHSFGGIIITEICDEKIHVLAKDTGPGIPDIGLAMQEGYSTASAEVREMGFGAGMGLPNIKNNTDSLSIRSSAEGGTEMEMEIHFPEGECQE